MRLAVAAFLLVAGSQGAPERPNIVFILADDLGATDLGCYGSRFYETPHVDRLRREGMKFTAAYTCGPNCAPTRAALMTGKYGPRTGIYTVTTGARGKEEFRKLVPAQNRTDLDPSHVTIAEALKAAGYATAAFGKWHLGGPESPLKQGFDVYAGIQKANFPGTDFITERAVEFLEKKKDAPFFLYLPYHAVHTPIRAESEDLVRKYEAKAKAGGHKNPVYAAMLEELDRGVGRVLEKLDELKLAERTIVLFSSDNGGVGGYASAGVKGGGEITHNAPFRGGKGMLYEGGIRVPLLVRWPGVVKPGSECGATVTSVDFLPTLLEAAKADPPARADGASFAGLLRGESRPERDHIWHFPGYLEADVQRGTWRTTPCGAIRSGEFKLLEFFEDGRRELYNLREDVGETRDLAASMPEKAQELHEKLVAWRKAVAAPMPQSK